MYFTEKHLACPTYIAKEHRTNNFQVQGLKDSIKINTIEHKRQRTSSQY